MHRGQAAPRTRAPSFFFSGPAIRRGALGLTGVGDFPQKDDALGVFENYSNQKGLLKLKGILFMDVIPTLIPVTAAPSVPPPRPRQARPCGPPVGTPEHYPLETGEGGCEQGPARLWGPTFIHLLLVCHCAVNLLSLSVLPSDCQLVCHRDAQVCKVRLSVMGRGLE